MRALVPPPARPEAKDEWGSIDCHFKILCLDMILLHSLDFRVTFCGYCNVDLHIQQGSFI